MFEYFFTTSDKFYIALNFNDVFNPPDCDGCNGGEKIFLYHHYTCYCMFGNQYSYQDYGQSNQVQ